MPSLIHPDPFIISPPDNIVQANLELKSISNRLAEKYADRKIVADADLETIGRRLWDKLGVQEDFEGACERAGASILRLIIESNFTEVQALPWETLYHPSHGFLGHNPKFTLTRRAEAGNRSLARLEKGPLRVLLFTCLPEDVNPETGRLRVEEEQARVQEALLTWMQQGLVQLEMPDDGRFSTLQESLKSFQPHMLFLSGHGRFYHAPHAGEAYGEIFFESETGESEAVSESRIAEALRGTSLQAVVFVTCESGQAASDALSNGLAHRISEQGIPHVIGMRESIADSAGIAFTQSLCDLIAKQEPIDVAMQSTRATLSSKGEPGQWCLPMLISYQPHRPLIDWEFQPKEIETASPLKSNLDSVTLPKHFVGRRAELRRFKNRLLSGNVTSLLITGPGGQGKTSLAGKLALDMQNHDWQVFAWCAKSEKSWQDFELEMQQTLEELRTERLNRYVRSGYSEQELISSMFSLLVEQFDRVILFLDQLETVQDPITHALNDRRIAAGVQAARQIPGLILLVTSRWQLPDWDGEHLALPRLSYGDFLQMAEKLRLPPRVLKNREELRRIYDALGGNSRGLMFYFDLWTAAGSGEQDARTELLAKAKEDLKVSMAIAEAYRRLPQDAQTLLARLPAFHVPVPFEGLVHLGADLSDPEALVEHLLAVSLLEASEHQQRETTQYQVDPLVRDWLKEQKLIDADWKWINASADFQVRMLYQERDISSQLWTARRALRRANRLLAAERLTSYLRVQERQMLAQSLETYHALRRADRHSEADRLALDLIVGPLTMAGAYQRLLTEFLPGICNSEELQTRARALTQTGMLLKNTGEYEQALLKHKKALEIVQQLRDTAGEAIILNNIALVYQSQGDYGTALSHLERAAMIQRRRGNKVDEGIVLNNIGEIYRDRGDYETTLQYLRHALSLHEQTDNQAGIGSVLSNIAATYLAKAEYETALEYLKHALAIQRQAGDKSGEGTILGNISGIYQRRGNYETALKYLKQARAIQEKIGDKAGEATTLNNISGICRRQGDYDSALEYSERAREVQHQIGELAGEATTLNNIATVYQIRGEYEKALAYLEKSLNIRERLGDEASKAQSLNNIGTVHQAQGRQESALEKLEEALAIQRRIGARAGESTTLNNIATIYQAKGDYEIALNLMKQALDIAQGIGDLMGEATTLNNIATLYQALGDSKRALEYLKQALEIRRQIGDQTGEAQSLSNIAIHYQQQGEPGTALEYLKQALPIQEQISDNVGLCATLLTMGHIHLQNKQTQETQGAWAIAYVIAKQIKLKRMIEELGTLASNVGLSAGLDDWETRVQQIEPKSALQALRRRMHTSN